MSQLLTQALQDVLWAEEQLEAAEPALLARNRTQQPRLPPWAPASLFMHWSWARRQVAPPPPHFSPPHFSPPHFSPPPMIVARRGDGASS